MPDAEALFDREDSMSGKKGSRIKQIRALLRASPDGLTVADLLAEVTRIDKAHASRILRSMPDAYIDRWVSVHDGRWHRAVWCVVVPPEHCPRPHRKNEVEIY
jgi:hypothetical protein